MIVWPSDLPQRFRVDGTSHGFGEGRRITQTEEGPPKISRRMTLVPEPAAVSFRTGADGIARLRRFWVEELRQGSLPFLIPDPYRDGQPLLLSPGVPLLDDAGRPLLIPAYWLCLMGSTPPTPTPVPGAALLQQVNLSLTVMP